MFHMKLQHAETCNECSRIPGTNLCVGDQTTRGQKFQCSECGLKFTDESSLENHIDENHEVTYGILNTKTGNNPHFEYHKYKHRESTLKTPAASADGKKSIDEALTASCMGQIKGGKMLDESRDDDDNSHSSHFSNLITQKFQCGTCGDKFTEDNESENHIAQEHEFNKSGLRFADENSLENQTFDGHKFTWKQFRDKNTLLSSFSAFSRL